MSGFWGTNLNIPIKIIHHYRCETTTKDYYSYCYMMFKNLGTTC